MKQFKKWPSVLLVAVLLISLLCACAPQDAKPASKDAKVSQASEEKTTAEAEKSAESEEEAQADKENQESKSAANDKKDLKKVDFILDWVPNTNHTGLFVAKDKGYFEEVGIDLDIKQPPEDSTSDLIINNKAPFGIYFQDSMAAKLSKGAPLVAVAAIIEHNTSGVVASEASGIKNPEDLVGKRYGTWNDPMELAMLQYLVESRGGKYEDVKLVPNTDANTTVSIENDMFDSAWIYYAWDGIMAETKGMKMNFFYFKDYAPVLDFYSPIIISNETYLKENPDEARAILAAIRKGYQYAIEHPEEAADILIANAPELESSRDFVVASQKYLSDKYAENPEHWGEFDPARWNAFYKWVSEQGIVENPIPENAGFSNEYIAG